MMGGEGGLLLAVHPQIPRQLIAPRATDAPGGHRTLALRVVPVALDEPLNRFDSYMELQRRFRGQ